MVLEATVVCIDNSEWMRNGDYPPSRLDAQQDAVNLLCGAKTNMNPESSVGLLTMAGKSARILVTQTNDDTQIITSLHQVNVDGNCDFIAAIRKAQLALKHRQNQQQRQRIIVFVGSPLDVDETTLKKVGKDLKKNNVAVDLINFGEEEHNSSLLEIFLQAVNSDNNSHLVTVPAGPHILSDVLLRSPIIAEDGSSADVGRDAGAEGSSSQFPFGVDPQVDPELAMALSQSIEEERERQARAAAQQEGTENATGATAMEEDTPGAAGGATAEAQEADDELYASAETDMQVDSSAAAAGGETALDATLDEEVMDEEMRLAIEMSRQEANNASNREDADNGGDAENNGTD